MLIIESVKVWRFCTIERFEPKVEACERTEFRAVLSLASSASILSSLSRSASSSVVDTPRLAELMVSPSLVWMSMDDVPVSLKVMASLSPRSRLIPLNEASSASLSSWSRSSLN
ncbi:hypothetical protein D3C72_2129160 [compost metagenome]